MVDSTLDIQENENYLRISWDNRKIKKNRAIICFEIFVWIICVSIAISLSIFFFMGKDMMNFLVIAFLFIGWYGSIAFPYHFVRIFKSEWIEFNHEKIVWGIDSILFRNKEISVSKISQITVGRYVDNAGEKESEYSLSIFIPRGWFGILETHREYKMARWLQEEEKSFIFEKMHRFALSKGLLIKFNRFWD